MNSTKRGIHSRLKANTEISRLEISAKSLDPQILSDWLDLNHTHTLYAQLYIGHSLIASKVVHTVSCPLIGPDS